MHISVNKENLGWPICQYGWGMGDFKKWGDLSNEGDGFEMGGGGDTPLQTMFINKDLLEYRFAILWVSCNLV